MVLKYIYAIKISILLYYLLCLLMTSNARDSKSILVLHVTGLMLNSNPNGQPLNVMFLFAIPTDLRSSTCLKGLLLSIASGFMMS